MVTEETGMKSLGRTRVIGSARKLQAEEVVPSVGAEVEVAVATGAEMTVQDVVMMVRVSGQD